MILRIIAIIVFLLVVGGIVYVAFWDIPPPTAPVEKVLPDDRIPR